MNLNKEQIEMLKMSEDDIANGRLISQQAMDKRNLEWLNNSEFLHINEAINPNK